MYCGGKTPHPESAAAQLGSVSETAHLPFGVGTHGTVLSQAGENGDRERKERMFGQNRKENTSPKEITLGHPSLGMLMAIQFSCFLSLFHVSRWHKGQQLCGGDRSDKT